MKKALIFILITLMITMAFASCGNGGQEEENLPSGGEENSTTQSDDVTTDGPQDGNGDTVGVGSEEDYCGAYTTTSNENGDMIEIAEALNGDGMYQISKINILSEVYRNAELTDYSTVFSAEDIESGSVDIQTNFGCVGTVTFNGNGTISLHLECNDAVYDSDFAK